jgi:hypothetical protein
VIKFVVNHHKTLALYRALAAKEPNPPVGGTELMKFTETRFASKVMMLIRYYNVVGILEKLVVDTDYLAWVGRQTRDVKNKAAEIKIIVRDEELVDAIAVCIKVLQPCMLLLRLTDGKTGATLGHVFARMLALDVFYRNPIDGLDDSIRKKLHKIFLARWEYFHVPVMTAAYRFEPQFCRRELEPWQVWPDPYPNRSLPCCIFPLSVVGPLLTIPSPAVFPHQEAEVKTVLRKMATAKHRYSALLAEYGDYEVALLSGDKDLTDEVAFSGHAQGMAGYKWAMVYLAPWPGLKYVAMRLLSLSCSASGCEHSWSVEGWMHSKKRNRLGQLTVERLVRTHTNLLLEAQLDNPEHELAVLPWDLEMVVDEPDDSDASDDESDEQGGSDSDGVL